MFAYLESVFHLPWMLAGLAVVVIPPLIHLLNRRRYEVIDWGAMQFLQVSEVTRRRLMLEELLLMLFRMGLLAVLVLALAGPFMQVALPPSLAGRPARDVVLVFDGSASMAATDAAGGKTPAEKAKEWALAYVEALGPTDGVAVLQAREQPVPLVGELSVDRKRVRERIEKAAAPAGSANWPDAVKQAFGILASGQNRRREVILLGDGQRFSWADPETVFRWELLAGELGLSGADDNRPRVWYADVAGDWGGQPPNYGLAPLVVNRPVVPVDREVLFRSEIVLSGQKSFAPPHRLRLEIDGKPVRDLPPPGGRAGAALPLPRDGKVPFSFTQRFGQPGSHLVSVIVEPDPPAGERPAGYEPRDRVPGDNRQDYAIEVVTAVPVVLVTGDRGVGTGPRPSDFLRDALAPARDPNPVVQLRVVPAADLSSALLAAEPRPRVVILHDVPRLDPAQAEALTTFVGLGGGVLVAPGDRVVAGWYNDTLFRGGEGWLPALLEGPVGDENALDKAFRPDPASFTHPVLDVFRQVTAGGLAEARFPRSWRLTIPGKHSAGVPVGQLEAGGTRIPLFVERSFQAGRALVSAVPLDASWRTNLVDLPAFVPLVHEAVYYLAGARATDFNLRPGQPIRYPLEATSTLENYRLTPPDGVTAPLSDVPGQPETYLAQVVKQERGPILVYPGARTTGVYALQTPGKQTVYFVAPPDPRESDLAHCTTDEQQRVAALTGVRYEDDRSAILEPPEESTGQQDLWLYLLLALIGLLVLEVWMTRRLVMSRG